MSIENFFGQYRGEANLKEKLKDERLYNRSSVATLALNLAKEAGDGLREYTGKLEEPNVALSLDSESLLTLPQDIRNKIIINHAGVIFGVSIPPLEQCYIDGSFDLEEWCSFYNLSISGTRLSKMKTEEGRSKEILSKDNLQKGRQALIKDPTFSSLFAEDIQYIPKSLRNMLVKSQIIPTIQQDIIPSWKELSF
jgi:hypothetical protein